MVPQHLADSRYISLVTYRKSGAPVATPVWSAECEGKLLVWTKTDTGKVRRLRNDVRVTVAPCTLRGRPLPDGESVTATARLMEGRSELMYVRRAMARKYGWQFRVWYALTALVRLGTRPYTGIAVTCQPDPVLQGRVRR